LLAGFLATDFLSLFDFLEATGLFDFTGFEAGFLDGDFLGTGFLAGYAFFDFTG